MAVTGDEGVVLPKPDARQISADQTAAIPDVSRSMIGQAVDEFEIGETTEAICARDAVAFLGPRAVAHFDML